LHEPLADYFKKPFEFCGKRIRGRFAIPSGIRTVRGSVIRKCFSDFESIGVITTKSISAKPRVGYREPIYARYTSGSYINAVGLSNPGAVAFRQELERDSKTPSDKFLLVSIFGAGEDEFVEAAKELAPLADGFELNMSCPHASGYGIEIGQDADLLVSIVRAVRQATGVPVIVKLSATLARTGYTAKRAIDAGASGITVTNTIGPSMAIVGQEPILHHRFGGLSGDSIRPLGLMAVDATRRAIGNGPAVIGMGGIGTGEHVLQFRSMGADIFGLGSVLTGLNTKQMATFLGDLERACIDPELTIIGSVCPDSFVPMDYRQARIIAKNYFSDRLYEIALDNLPESPRAGELAGKYYFLCIPGVGEKPFAIFSASAKSVVIRTVGIFTEYLSNVPVGTPLLIRGPYGAGIQFDGFKRCLLVGGGTGTASLLEIGIAARRRGFYVSSVIGSRTAREVFGVQELEELGPVSVATDDASRGFSGRVSQLLEQIMSMMSSSELEETLVVNCGPEPMIYACASVEKRFVDVRQIIGSIEYHTSCGVGICGKCASPSGHLSCIDGPFLPIEAFGSSD